MPKGGARPGAGRPPKFEGPPSRISKEPLAPGVTLKMKTGPKPGQYPLYKKNKTLSRSVIESRIRELVRMNTEAAKAEAARLAVALMPYEEPKLQAVMAQVQTMGDRLDELMKQIDGSTTGISPGQTSPLLVKHIVIPEEDDDEYAAQ